MRAAAPPGWRTISTSTSSDCSRQRAFSSSGSSPAGPPLSGADETLTEQCRSQAERPSRSLYSSALLRHPPDLSAGALRRTSRNVRPI